MTAANAAYGAVARLVLAICRVPAEPDPPLGSPCSLKVFRAAPAYYRYRLWLFALGNAGMLLGIGAMALAAVAVRLDAKAPRALEPALFAVAGVAAAAWLVMLPFGYASQRLDYELRWYMITDRSLRIREGITNVREMTLTFANVQNVAIDQGPLQRLLAIADLRVQTAGGSAGSGGEGREHALHVGLLRGVADAAALRELVLERQRAARDAGLGDPDDVRPATGPEAAAKAAEEMAGEARALRAAAERLAAARRTGG